MGAFNEPNPRALPKISPSVSVGCCLLLSVMYVSSLYVWKNKHNRDHPATVKRRFCSVFFVMLIAPIFVYKFSNDEFLKRASFLNILGLRLEGLIAGICVPFMLTAILFLGPLCVQLCNGTLQMYFNIEYWKMSFGNILWIRNHVVAPLSEEFAFRACMMPLILQSFSPWASVFITPLFFGIAHLHHIAERLRSGIDIKKAIAISCFQLTYTTLFGFYSAYLFAKTGHFVAPFIAHAFCNHMGFGYLQDLWQQVKPKRLLLITCYITGLVGWIYLLPIATNPALYSNQLYWNAQKIS